MIPPTQQWAIQIDVTTRCNRACSNCTRLVGHDPVVDMDVPTFRRAVNAIRDFPEHSEPTDAAPNKLIGLIGGEPLMHPQFRDLVHAMAEVIPRDHRGLWTGLNWQRGSYASLIEKAFCTEGIHNNRHDLAESYHSPILVASRDVIEDPTERAEAIDNCWLQRQWCGTITPKGHFFCEVAGSLDRVLNGPGGLPVEDECWRRPLDDFREQVDTWCQRCGVALNLLGREANEGVDDISRSNLELLRHTSHRVRDEKYRRFNVADRITTDKPWEYRQ